MLIFISLGTRAQSLSGTVFDGQTKETLPGASVYIPDLKSGAVTDSKGHYEITNLPKRKFTVVVKSIGYGTVSLSLDLAVITKKDFGLSVAAIESPEVVITGSAFSSEKSQSSIPVEQLGKINITTVPSNNIVNAIATTPGVSAISTGEAVSKPVIRGLGFNRIVVVNEGVRQEGQQWGNDHGLEIDEFSADRIEVLKGPSSLLYGSDALGGVINILEPVSPSSGKIQGEVVSKYSTNNLLTANSLMLEGNQQGFVWRGRGSYKNAIPYNTPSERIYNSGFDEKNAAVLAGLNRSWGYSHLHLSLWESGIGFPEGKRDSVSGQLLNNKDVIATEQELHSRTPVTPWQEVSHGKLSVVNNIIIGQSQLRVNAGWQQNDRKEFSDPGSAAGMWLHLSTLTYDGRYYFPQSDTVKGIETVIGFSGMNQQNENRGSEFLVPDYKMNEAGAFLSAKKSFRKSTINAGARYDFRHITGEKMVSDSNEIFKPLASQFSSFSGSIGMTSMLNKFWDVKANIGSGFRAPNISELSANGIHEGTFRYEIGNPLLKPEKSLQFDVGITADGKKIGFSLDGFYNLINNYIYYRHTTGDSVITGEGVFPAYRYTQGFSTLKGFELSLDIHPVSNLHFQTSLAYVAGINEDLNNPLPFIPPLKIESELQYTFKTKKTSHLSDPYIKIEAENIFRQDRVDEFETPTNGYTILNGGIGTNIKVSKQRLLIFIAAKNILNKEYYNHLSSLKEKGIHDMGRNIIFGLQVPFGLK
jgi:iron complex outermembrane receptor protein